jgi:hypothetical protein
MTTWDVVAVVQEQLGPSCIVVHDGDAQIDSQILTLGFPSICAHNSNNRLISNQEQ